MKCNCSKWEDNLPCDIHGVNKLPRPEIVWHTQIVISICRRSSNLKWFYTITKDAIRVFESGDFATKKEVENVLALGVRL